MPINPAIALAVQPLELPDPLAQYSKIAAIQSAQQQNALAQYQLEAARREEASTNALNQAYQSAYNPETGKVDVSRLRGALATGGFGSKIAGVEKTLGELEKLELERKELQGKVTAQPTALETAKAALVDAKLKQSRQFLDTIDPADPNAPEMFMRWHKANHDDPVLGPLLAARGVTAEQSRARIAQAVAQGPAAFAQLLAQSKLGAEKFAELNRAQNIEQNLGGTTRIVSVPGLGGPATVVPGSTAAVTMTPYQQGQLNIAKQRLEAETAVGDLTPETVDFVANLYTQTGQLPPLGIGKSAAKIKTQILNRAQELTTGGGATPAEAAAGVVGAKQTRASEQATLKAFSSGVESRSVRSFNTAIDHLDTMSKLATALQNNDTRLFNTVANAFGQAVGREAPTNFDTAKSIVGGEVAKALAGSSMALKDREEIRDTISRANSPEQLAGSVRTLQELMGGQLKSLRLQYETGTNRKDFDTRLSPRAKQVVSGLEGGAATPASAAAGATSVTLPDGRTMNFPNAAAAAAFKKAAGL